MRRLSSAPVETDEASAATWTKVGSEGSPRAPRRAQPQWTSHASDSHQQRPPAHPPSTTRVPQHILRPRPALSPVRPAFSTTSVSRALVGAGTSASAPFSAINPFMNSISVLVPSPCPAPLTDADTRFRSTDPAFTVEQLLLDLRQRRRIALVRARAKRSGSSTPTLLQLVAELPDRPAPPHRPAQCKRQHRVVVPSRQLPPIPVADNPIAHAVDAQLQGPALAPQIVGRHRGIDRSQDLG